MPEFIFYTTEGFAEAPNGRELENAQLLGTARGETAKRALANLLEENAWILENGYKEVFALEVSGQRLCLEVE